MTAMSMLYMLMPVATLVVFGLLFAWLFVAIYLGLTAEGRGKKRLATEGMRARAVVVSSRRISMTQHRVLFRIEGPAGPTGREYVMTGLNDAWLADVCAVQRPINVVWAPHIAALIIEA